MIMIIIVIVIIIIIIIIIIINNTKAILIQMYSLDLEVEWTISECYKLAVYIAYYIII